jgi:hypothetical protein
LYVNILIISPPKKIGDRRREYLLPDDLGDLALYVNGKSENWNEKILSKLC